MTTRSRVWIRILILTGLLCLSGSALAANHSTAPIQWTAKVIWPPVSAIAAHSNQFMLFRKTFTLTTVPSAARLAILADSRYRLYVNGTYIGQGPARAPHYWFYYDVFDVASNLRAGQNVIAVEVRWYGQSMAWYEAPYTQATADSPLGSPDIHGALICQLEATVGGQQTVIPSDSSWKAREDHAWEWNTPRMNDALADIEVYHADREEKGWTGIGFDDSNWVPAAPLTSFFGGSGVPPIAPYVHLAPRPMAYPLEREEAPANVVAAGVFPASPPAGLFFGRGNTLSELGSGMAEEKNTPQSSIVQDATALTSPSTDAWALVQPAPPGEIPYVILDMGREVDGYMEFRVESPHPATMNIGWSEMMEHGDITANRPAGDYVAQYWTSPGSQSWTMWGWHGLRFIELSFPDLSAPLRFHVMLRFSTAKLDHAGSFSSSSPLLTKLWQMGAYTFQLCTLDGTMDCPTREQRQWVGDGGIELQVNGVANGTLDIARKFLLDASRDQWSDGGIPAVSDTGSGGGGLIDSYVFSFINALNGYYLQTGDRAFVQQLYPSVVKALMWFQGFRQPDGLLGDVPYWNFLDWSNPDSRGESSILNALYADTLDNATELADVAGDTYHAGIFRADSTSIHAIFNDRFWNAKLGLYVDAWNEGHQSEQVGQLANADAVNFGFAPKDQIGGILDKITNPARIEHQSLDQRTMQFVIPSHPPSVGQDIVQAQTYGTYFLLSALAKYGRARAVREVIEDFWGPMAKAGNDTFWEDFVQSAGTSCHAWSAAPTFFLTTLILGVQPTKPGYAEYTVAPHPAGLEWAKGTVPTVHGDVRVDWQWTGIGSDRRFVLHIDNPPQEIARVVLPEQDGRAPSSIALNGKRLPAPVEIDAPGSYTVEGQY
jgi:alpha-L-rhamnosidase